MEYSIFCEEVRRKVAEKTGHKTKIIDVLKNNNLTLKALSIIEEKSNVSPQIYLEDFYDKFINSVTGIDIDDIAESVISFYEKHRVESVTGDFFYNFEDLRNNIHYKIINADANKTLLDSVPNDKFLDLAKVYVVNVNLPGIGLGNILINNKHLEIWQVTVNDLEMAAFENLQNEEILFQSLNDMVSSIVLENEIGDFDIDCLDENGFMYVLSNKDKFLGARLLLRKNLLHDIAEKLKSDLIILPSSLHEVIILKDKYKNDVDNLHDMVQDVNGSVVDKQDFLSDNVYLYVREENKIEIL